MCIYMCGTDLETHNSAATYDLLEMRAADIPDNVNVIVMTGGTAKWNPFEIDKQAVDNGIIKKGAYVTPDSDHTQIYQIDDDKMKLVYTYDENFDMGDVCTLEKFLEFSLYYAPAEHLMVSMWNHGGGPLSGVEYDENTKNIISVPEYTKFAEALFKARGEKTDILGFDACLMGNFEFALNVAPYADYMVYSPWAPAIRWAMESGVIRGITDKTFAPDKKITRLEMIVMLARFDEERGNLLAATEPEIHLADCDKIPAWGKSAVHWAVANDMVITAVFFPMNM